MLCDAFYLVRRGRKANGRKNERSQFHHVPVKISGPERLPYHSDLGVSWKNTSVLNISYKEQNLPNHGSASKGLNSVPLLDYVYEKGKLIQEIFAYSSGEQSKADDPYDELCFLS